MLIEDEGLKLKPYKCPAGKLTIGIGHNLDDNGITPEVADLLLKIDLQNCLEDALDIFGNAFYDWTDRQQQAVINMIFNLGANKFQQFHNTIKAIKAKDWEAAIFNARQSLWAKQVPERAKRVFALMRNEDVYS